MLYPSGMLVARPAADGTGSLSYTKHYFAGSQRVSSKIGTTTNLGKFLQEWTLIENTSGGAPINLVSTSGNQLTKAETGVTHVYTQFGITPTPTFNSNTAFLPVPAFTGTAAETEAFWFHPDHLGSSNYITNFVGEVSQHMEYFAFGETFVEEHKNSHNSPYKFNEKELDEESGLYYYGARYYSSRENLWASVDPYQYDGTYLSGNHNGGVFNNFNLNSFAYCYQNPIRYIDPNGKQVNKTKSTDQKGAELFITSIATAAAANDANANVHSTGYWAHRGVLTGRSVNIGGTYTDTDVSLATRTNMLVSGSNTAFVNESNAQYFNNYEAHVVNMLMQNFMEGKGPEIYIFPTNGIISSKFRNSDVFKQAYSAYLNGENINKKQVIFKGEELKSDLLNTGTLFSITGFAGSGIMTFTPRKNDIMVSFFNITSLTSGYIFKNPDDNANWLPSYRREQGGKTKFGNIGQIYSFTIPYPKSK